MNSSFPEDCTQIKLLFSGNVCSFSANLIQTHSFLVPIHCLVNSNRYLVISNIVIFPLPVLRIIFHTEKSL